MTTGITSKARLGTAYIAKPRAVRYGFHPKISLQATPANALGNHSRTQAMAAAKANMVIEMTR